MKCYDIDLIFIDKCYHSDMAQSFVEHKIQASCIDA